MSSAAHFLNDEQENKIKNNFEMSELEEIKIDDEFIQLYPNVKKRLQSNQF